MFRQPCGFSPITVAVLAVVSMSTLGGVYGAVVANVGLAPPATYNIALSDVQRSFAADVARAMSIATTDVTLVQAAVAAESSTAFNATLRFSPESLTQQFFTLAMVTRTANTLYTAFLMRYNIELVAIVADSSSNATTAIVNTTAAFTTEMTTNATAPMSTTNTPVPTQPQYTNTSGQAIDDGSGSGDSTKVIIIVFAILGVIALVGCITFAVKKWVKRDKKDTSKRGGGYKYATRQAQHI